MDSSESLKQFELLEEDNIPPWAFSFFGKMKSEICAEVHAKIAYSVRIMLDKLREDLKASFKPIIDDQSAPSEECFCKDINKCNEKLAAVFATQYAMMKKQQKQTKRASQEFKKCNKIRKNFVSESDTDNEKSVEPIFTDNLSTLHDPTKIPPPVPPRKTSPLRKLLVTAESNLNNEAASNSVKSSQLLLIGNKEHKLLNGPVEPESEEKPVFEELAVDKSDEDSSSKIKTKTSSEDVFSAVSSELQRKETQLSPSDSEFEVISMPHNINPVPDYFRLPDEPSDLISDYEDSSSSNDETETEVTDYKSLLQEKAINSQPSGSLYPELELKKMSLSMASSTTSTLLDGYMSSCSNEGAVALDPAAEDSIQIERERAPYSVPSEDVEKINRQEIVHSQPLPSEFLRVRKPYSHIPIEEQQQQPHLSTPKAQLQEQPIPKCSSQQRNQRDSTYRVDNLPESLWDEALTVAAQTYNAAKTAVENLADTFVPGADKATGNTKLGDRSSPRMETPRNACSISPATSSFSQANSSPVRTQPTGMTQKEQKLVEMGFVDHNLNATLLLRHNGDMDRVIAELIEP